jgi:hypothetical protein
VDRPNRVAYRTVQAGLPDADHERLFEPRNDGFRYRLTVSYRPRRGFAALLDRTVVRLGADGVTVLVGVAGHAAARTLRGLGRDWSANGAG